MRYWSLLTFVFVLSVAKSQGISGVVVDEKNEPVAYASISLLQANDSSFVTGTTTDIDGKFSMNGDNADKLLKVSYVGYATQYLQPALDMRITMTEAGISVGDVVITGSRPVFKMKNGALVAPIENTVLGKLGDGIDVLQQLPFINGDGNSVSVIGRQGTPLVYINNRKMQDWNELRQLSSDMIKDVQIIMSPGVEYDSSVTAVIKITTLRPTGEGLGGYVAAETGKGDDFAHNEWLFLNYRKKNTDVFINGYLANGTIRGLHKEEFSFTHHGDGYHAVGEGLEKNKYNRLNLYAGFNHQPS